LVWGQTPKPAGLPCDRQRTGPSLGAGPARPITGGELAGGSAKNRHY
jgi:hypothetical protein